jgi:hypothetical protein
LVETRKFVSEHVYLVTGYLVTGPGSGDMRGRRPSDGRTQLA